MLTAKGRAEILTLIGSDLVNTWGETQQTLKKTVQMLLLSRPDLIRNYFFPDVWAKISQLEKKQAARLILSAMMATVVKEAGEPAVEAWDQAVFYMATGVHRYMDMAEAWSQANPECCEYPLRAPRRGLTQAPLEPE